MFCVIIQINDFHRENKSHDCAFNKYYIMLLSYITCKIYVENNSNLNNFDIIIYLLQGCNKQILGLGQNFITLKSL